MDHLSELNDTLLEGSAIKAASPVSDWNKEDSQRITIKGKKRMVDKLRRLFAIINKLGTDSDRSYVDINISGSLGGKDGDKLKILSGAGKELKIDKNDEDDFLTPNVTKKVSTYL